MKKSMRAGLFTFAIVSVWTMNAGAATIEEQILYDAEGVTITAKSLEEGGIFGPEIQLLIENNSEQDICVQIRNGSVNGYMVDYQMSADVPAGKKVNDGISLMQTDLDDAQIEEISALEFSFHIFDSESWDTLVDTEMIELITSESEYEQVYDDSGDVIYDENQVKIISKGLSDDGLFGPEIKLYIENNREEPITVQARDVSIDGFMVDPLLSEELMPGKKSLTEMTFMDSELEENGILSILSVESTFHIFNTDSWDTIADTDIIVISAGEEGESNSYEESDNVIFESNQIKIVYQGISEEGSWLGPEVMLYIENNSDVPVGIQARDTSVDGFMVDPIMSAEIMPGKKCVSSMTFMNSQLEENGIEELKNIETSFHIFNNDTWDTIVDSDTITLEQK